MSKIKVIDEQLFWWINSHHNSIADWLLWTISQPWSWLVLILLVYLFVTVKCDRRNWLWVLVGIALCFLLADQISNNAIKEGIQRLRPCYQFEDVRMFHTNRGGLYGFVSSHAANAFAVATFLSLVYGKRRKWLTFILLAWALLVAYSRCYLGKHFPGDVICGALLGLGVGAMIYFAIATIKRKAASRSSA